jgi:hypothetical protein
MMAKEEITEYHLPDVSASIIMETVEGICHAKDNGLTIPKIAEYIGKTETYAQRAVGACLQLGMIKENNGCFVCTPDAMDITRANKEQRPMIFRKFLQRYNPFILFVMLMSKDNSPEVAARKVRTIYSISGGSEITLRALLGWGIYSDLLTKSKGNVILKIEPETLSAEYVRELLEALESDIKARVYIARKLGDEVFGYLRQDEVDYITKALRKHEEDPRNSVDDAGRAFEDFLRRLAIDNKVDVCDCTGIGQIADRLLSEKKILDKQHKMCMHINSVRIAAAHGKEPKTLEPWKINADAVLEIILTILTTIRSIHSYVFKQDRII